MYVKVDFICIGWFELWATRRKRKLQNKKSLAHSGTRTHVASRLLDSALLGQKYVSFQWHV